MPGLLPPAGVPWHVCLASLDLAEPVSLDLQLVEALLAHSSDDRVRHDLLRERALALAGSQAAAVPLERAVHHGPYLEVLGELALIETLHKMKQGEVFEISLIYLHEPLSAGRIELIDGRGSARCTSSKIPAR